MADPNIKIYDDIRANLTGSNRYQQVIGAASQVGIERVISSLLSPQNHDVYNQFCEGLINLVGNQILRSKIWTNPMSDMKRYSSFMGQSIQEIGMGLLQTKGYDPKDTNLFAPIENPDVKAAYHSMNVTMQGAYSLNDNLLQRAMKTGANLAEFAAGFGAAAETTFNLNEFTIMKQLWAKHDEIWKIFNVNSVNLNNPAVTLEEVKRFLIQVKTMVGEWRFVRTKYNAYGIPTFTNKDEIVLVVTPAIAATIEVLCLSAAFNVSFAELNLNIKTVDEMPIPNCVALMFDENFTIYSDVVNNIEYFRNPKAMTNDYYYNRMSIASTSPMLNICKFTTDVATQIPAVTATPTTYTANIYNANNAVVPSISLADDTFIKGLLSMIINPVTPGISGNFTPSIFEITAISHITVGAGVSAAATVSGTGITGATVNANTFAAIVVTPGTYAFSYSAAAWHQSGSVVTLAPYGIVPIGTAATGDTITVVFALTDVTTTLPINSRTYVDDLGKIHLQAAASVGDVITIKATSTYNNDGVGTAVNDTITKTFTVSA